MKGNYWRYLGPIVVFSSTLCLWGQTTSTEILGLVRDASGGVIPGVEVSITRVATGEVRRGLTNESGQYSFPLVEPGVYRVHVEMPGFRPHTVSGVNVQFQQRARVDVTLQVGELTDVVEVVAGARLLHTDDAAVGLNLETERVQDLPVVVRNIGHLAVVVPGVSFGGRMGRATGTAIGGTSGNAPGTTVTLVAHGQDGVNQNITLDGVDAKEPRYQTMNLAPSLDAVAEVNVQTAAYSAEYGLGGGAQVQISMKSGTNDFHGSLYNFVRNDALDAEHYFLNFELAPGEERRSKDRLRRNQFGTFLSGPVILPGYDGRNRTFWSLNYEGRRELSENVQTTWYPSQAMRAGDFSQLLNPVDSAGNLIRPPILIYDPLTGDPFPGNIIPENRIHPGARNLLQYVPLPDFQQSDPLDFTNRAAVPEEVRQDMWFIRVDHNFSEKDRVFVRLAWDSQAWIRPSINPHFGFETFNDPFNLATQWVHSFSPNMINEFRFGIAKGNDDAQERRATVDFDMDALGLGQFRAFGPGGFRELTPRENGIPLISGLGFAFGDGYAGGFNEMTTPQFGNHLTLLRGNHAFKMGFEYRRPALDRWAANWPRGILRFGALESGHGFASMLLGYPNSVDSPEGYPKTMPRSNLWSLYFLDNWRVNSKFTANLGLRYDYLGVPYDAGGFWRMLDFQRTYTTPEGMQIPTFYPDVVGEAAAVQLWDTGNRFFMPRIGLAYRPLDKWVIRAGGGWYANIVHYNNFTLLNLMPPYSGSLNFNSITDAAQSIPVTAAGETFNINTRRFRPGTPIVEMGDNLFAGEARIAPENPWLVMPDRKNASHWTWTLDIQRELPVETILTVGYVGSKTSNISGQLPNWNNASPSPDSDFQSRRPVQFFHDPLRPEIPVRQLGNIRYLYSGANAFYHGLTVSVDKRFSRGFAYGLAYTFSKAHGEATGDGQAGIPAQDPSDIRSARGPQAHDRPHMLVANFLYELPFLLGASGPTRAVLGGWQLNGIVAFRSGFPITVTQPQNLNLGGGGVRPDRIADGRLDNPTRELWFDPFAFQRVTCQIPDRLDLCRFGNSGVGILRGPSQKNLDLSLFKNFPLTFAGEGTRLQFRLEAFNAFNTPYFGNPTGIGFLSTNSIVPDAPRMGEIRSLAAPMRVMQVALKLMW